MSVFETKVGKYTYIRTVMTHQTQTLKENSNKFMFPSELDKPPSYANIQKLMSDKRESIHHYKEVEENHYEIKFLKKVLKKMQTQIILFRPFNVLYKIKFKTNYLDTAYA